jgi:hypothetical protein
VRCWRGEREEEEEILEYEFGLVGVGAGASHALTGIQVPEGGCWVTG